MFRSAYNLIILFFEERFRKNRRAGLLNYIIILSIGFVLIFALLYWAYFKIPLAVIVNLITVIFLLFGLLLNRYTHTAVASTWLISVMMCQFYILSMIIFGRESGIHLFYITASPVSFLLLDFRITRERFLILLCSLASVLLFLYCEWSDARQASLPEMQNKLLLSFSVIIIITALFFILGFFSVSMSRLNEELVRLASLDSLTGINNRRMFFEQGENIFALTQRARRPVSIMLIDIDHFKIINDSYGHPVGDTVLKTIATTINGLLRKTDLMARIGGEEFGIILPDTTRDGSIEVGKKICQTISDLKITINDSTIIRSSISIGVATSYSTARLDMPCLFKAADNALYTSKFSGRNRCTAVLVSNNSHQDKLNSISNV